MVHSRCPHALGAFAAAVSALLLAMPANAPAQTIQSPYRFVDENQALGFFAGYMVADDGEAELGPRSAPLFGGRYTLRLNGPFNVEATAGFLPTDRIVWDTAGEARVRRGEADLSLLLLLGGLRFDLTGPRVYRGMMPYLVAGGGAAIRISSDDALDATLSGPEVRYRFGTSFAGQLGGGVEWFALGRFTLNVDARLVFWNVDVPEAFIEADDTLSDSEWVQNYALSAGLSYRF